VSVTDGNIIKIVHTVMQLGYSKEAKNRLNLNIFNTLCCTLISMIIGGSISVSMLGVFQ